MKAFEIATVLFWFVTTGAIGQTKTCVSQNRTYHHKNPFEKTFTKVQKVPTFGTDAASLKSYLGDKLKNPTPQTEGQVNVGLLIDSTGKPICEWIENASRINTGNGKLNKIIDEMPYWNAGMIAKRKVDCAMTLVLTFTQQDFMVQCSYRTQGE